MPKRKFFWTSEGRPHSYGSPLAARCLGLRPMNVLITAKASPRSVPRPRKTIAGR